MKATLDDLLDQLDQAWAKDSIPDLAGLITRVPAEALGDSVELCAADMEWRWRKLSAQRNQASAADPLGSRPGARDYASLLGDSWEEVNHQRTLLEAEWSTRCVWGDRPLVDEFADTWAGFVNLHSRLVAILDDMAPLMVRLVSPLLKKPQAISATTPFIIGRQGKSDPEAPGWRTKPNKLVVANSHFRTISRNQLTVRRIRIHELQIENNSSSVPFTSDELELAPGQAKILQLPVATSVGEVQIQLQTPS